MVNTVIDIQLAGAVERMIDRYQDATLDWYTEVVANGDPAKTERLHRRMRRRRKAVTRLVESLRAHAEGAR